MRQTNEQLVQLIRPAINMLGYELVGLEYFPSGHQHTLRIYIDREQGIGVKDCECVSRQVSALLDVEDPIRGQYALEVSSPGLDRPLFTAEHFVRFSGHRVKLRLVAPHEGRRNFRGVIQGVEDGRVMLTMDDGQRSFSLQEIERARLVPEL